MNSVQTDVLYAGLNPVQEGALLSTPSANLLTGLGLDEFFTRTETAGLRAVLEEALGSTVALTDSAGAVQTAYTYVPFGEPSVSSQASTNPHQFTGREADGTDLYYYRARYYHPGLSRFVSEDPIEFGGGDANLFGYVQNQPTMLTDPNGLLPVLAVPILVGMSIGAINGTIAAAVNGQSLVKGAAIGAATGGAAALAAPLAGGSVVAGMNRPEFPGELVT